jgi:hypothetical protein
MSGDFVSLEEFISEQGPEFQEELKRVKLEMMQMPTEKYMEMLEIFLPVGFRPSDQ